MSTSVFIESIVSAMKDEIAKYGLELLQRYPNDLLVIDRSNLERFAVPGATIGWMVGHSHSHMAVLGLHQKENDAVNYFTNLSNDDRFYLLKISLNQVTPKFTLTEITRSNFGALATTKVPYFREGPATGFWLSKNGGRVGTVMLEWIGSYGRPRYRVIITPVTGISQLDRSALYEWGAKAVVEVAKTLFVSYDFVEQAPMRLLAAA